ncbi:hypothetical protein [Streptomyces boncukensis]|uniref:Uncharacterized protein n=1 Tax=Streptomyces boncukensis TaxID=2711219 RepID=A0A6G4WUJ4_9ACTN|nr:hypothetical protein [Streptomyces boncukensis]NGO68522.1 hypothetical protein [Streptomyces boncukensis]
MALWECAECTTAYAVGLSACPHCKSTKRVEDDMPKITRHGGPSVAGAVVTGGAWGDSDTWPDADTGQLQSEHGPELADQPDGEAETVTEVPSSPGNSSSASPEKPETSQKKSARAPRKRAPTTGNRSKRTRKADSDADTTAGDGPTTP